MRRLQRVFVIGSVLIRAGVILGAALVVMGGDAAASPILNVAGSTEACFGTGCSTYTTTTTSNSTYDLTFNGAAFGVVTDESGAFADILLGTLTRGNTKTPVSSTALPFAMEVTFTLPTGINGGQANVFTAVITGTSSSGGGGKLPVNFDNTWQLFKFSNLLGTGSFEFSVTNDPEVNKNHSDAIFGAIRNATFTAAEEAEVSSPLITRAPEPGMLLLLGTAAAAIARRRWPASQ